MVSHEDSEKNLYMRVESDSRKTLRCFHHGCHQVPQMVTSMPIPYVISLSHFIEGYQNDPKCGFGHEILHVSVRLLEP